MQGQHQYQPELFSQIDYQSLIPKNHLLRRIDNVLDLSFLSELTKSLYSSDFGRPSIAPEIFFRMILLQALYNIDSDRQLCEEVGYNLAYRWFCRLSLTDTVPDHSSMTKIRDRLGEKTYKEIFNRILDQCKTKGLVKLEQVMVDGSVIKANASIYTMKERDDIKSDDDEPPYSGQIHSKDGLSNNDLRKQNITGKKISNQTHVSSSDPDATLAGKAFEQKKLAYKTHHAIDASSRVIIDCHVTTGAVNEVRFVVERINEIEKYFETQIKELIADRGYGSAENLDTFEKRGISTNIPLWSSRSGGTLSTEIEQGFKIAEDGKTVTCPEGHLIKLSFREKVSSRNAFTLPRSTCLSCVRADTCLTAYEKKNRGKKLLLSDFYQIWLRTLEKQKDPEFKKKLWERMWKMEGIFAEAKSHHGLRKARYRGRWKVQTQVYVVSMVQNLKRLASAHLYELVQIYDFWRRVFENQFFQSLNPKNAT